MKKEELHARVLYLYQILRHYSDSEHPLTTEYSTHLVRPFRFFSAQPPEIQCDSFSCQCSPL